MIADNLPEFADLIEARLSSHPHLTRVAVVPLDDGGARRLVVYALSSREPEPDAEELRNQLASVVPADLLPSLQFVMLRSILPAPLLPSAKAEMTTLHDADGPQPGGLSMETIVLAICAKIMRLDSVKSADNFIDLGGQSLAAIKMVMRTEQVFRVSVPVRKLFECPTLGDFAQIVLDIDPRAGRTPLIARTLGRMLAPSPATAPRTASPLPTVEGEASVRLGQQT